MKKLKELKENIQNYFDKELTKYEEANEKVKSNYLILL